MADFFKILRSAFFFKPAPALEDLILEKPLKVTLSHEDLLKYCHATGDNPQKYDLDKSEFPPFYFSRFVFGQMKDILLNPIYKINFFRTVHAWQNIEFLNIPLKSKMDRVVFQVKNLKEVAAGWSFEVETTCFAANEPVIKSVSGLIIRSKNKRRKSHDEDRGTPIKDVFTELPLKTYKGQELDYSDISGDRNLIHRSSFVARLLGFRGRILHGLCTMTLVSNALIRELLKDDWTKVKACECRFSSPVYAGSPLSLFYKTCQGGSCGFSVKDQYGRSVLKKGKMIVE